MKKNIKKPINRYDVKKKTTTFVKERLPAYVLALLMVFWTIASILGIIAFAKNDTKKSVMSMVKANAESVPQESALREFEITLPCLQGIIYSGNIISDSSFVYFDGYEVFFVPSGYRQDFYGDDIDKNLFRLTSFDGSSYATEWTPIQIDNQVVTGITNVGDLTFDYMADSFPVYEGAFDFYYINTLTLYAERIDNAIRLSFAFDIFWVLDSVDVEIETFAFYLLIGDTVVNTTVFKVPAYGYSASSTGLPLTLIASDTSISNYDKQALYFTYYELYNDYNELVDLNNSYINALNELNTKLANAEEKIKEYEKLSLDYPIIENDLNNMISLYNNLKQDYASLQSQYNELQNEYESQLLNQYEQGKKAGYANGYDVGYAKGATDANEYTFDGLLSAVFDVPVRTFRSLFSFEILGINLANFFLSLLTLAIIIFVVRWII